MHTARRVDFHQQRQHGRAVPGASKNWRTLSQMLLSSVSFMATQAGIKTRFTSSADLVLELETAQRQGRLKEALHWTVAHRRLLVVDEIGYLPLTQDQANLMFQWCRAATSAAPSCSPQT